MPPDVELEQKLQKALVECEKLRSENADLKAKLRLEVNPQIADDNPSPISAKTGASSSSERAETEKFRPATVHNHSSSETKIALFRSLFLGREDIYALRWESNKEKAGYAPACGNEWDRVLCKKPQIKCSECTNSNGS